MLNFRIVDYNFIYGLIFELSFSNMFFRISIVVIFQASYFFGHIIVLILIILIRKLRMYFN